MIKINNRKLPIEGLTLELKNICWLCGQGGNITEHHVIPKSLDPKHNLKIGLCRPCHDRIEDGKSYAKNKIDTIINKNIRELTNALEKLK